MKAATTTAGKMAGGQRKAPHVPSDVTPDLSFFDRFAARTANPDVPQTDIHDRVELRHAVTELRDAVGIEDTESA